MGSPPKALMPLIDTDRMSISNFVAKSHLKMKLKTLQLNGAKSLGNLSSINFRDDPLVYGPHATCTVNSRSATLMKKFRPLSKIRHHTTFPKEDGNDIFGLKAKEKKARESPYLSHLKQQKREEMLMELGSIVNTIDEDLSIEVQLKSKLAEVVSMKSNAKGEKKKKKKDKRVPEQKLETSRANGQNSPLMYDVDSLNTESEYDLSDWGFNEGPMTEDGPSLDMYLSEFENDSSFDKDYINISPLSNGVPDEEEFGPEIFISRQPESVL